MPDELVPTETPESMPSAAQPPEYVSKAEFDAAKAEVAQLKGSLATAGSKLAVFDKVAEALDPAKATALSKEEQLVVSELKRLMPHVLPNTEFLEQAPQLAKAIKDASQNAGNALAQAAYGYQQELQKQAGMATDDPKVNYFLGTAIKEWINQDPERQSRFWRGDRSVIEDGFKEVQGLFALAKRAERKQALETASGRPHNAAPTSGTGVAGGEFRTTPDFSDRKSVRAALRAALS